LLRHQAAVLAGSALDALTLQQDGLPPAEIDTRRGQVVQALVIPLVLIMLDKILNFGLQRARQVLILQRDAVLHSLVPAFDLSLRLGVCGHETSLICY
jgi:hypothetical protein